MLFRSNMLSFLPYLLFKGNHHRSHSYLGVIIQSKERFVDILWIQCMLQNHKYLRMDERRLLPHYRTVLHLFLAENLFILLDHSSSNSKSNHHHLLLHFHLFSSSSIRLKPMGITFSPRGTILLHHQHQILAVKTLLLLLLL